MQHSGKETRTTNRPDVDLQTNPLKAYRQAGLIIAHLLNDDERRQLLTTLLDEQDEIFQKDLKRILRELDRYDSQQLVITLGQYLIIFEEKLVRSMTSREASRCLLALIDSTTFKQKLSQMLVKHSDIEHASVGSSSYDIIGGIPNWMPFEELLICFIDHH